MTTGDKRYVQDAFAARISLNMDMRTLHGDPTTAAKPPLRRRRCQPALCHLHTRAAAAQLVVHVQRVAVAHGLAAAAALHALRRPCLHSRRARSVRAHQSDT
jgi:hypothetical protein